MMQCTFLRSHTLIGLFWPALILIAYFVYQLAIKMDLKHRAMLKQKKKEKEAAQKLEDERLDQEYEEEQLAKMEKRALEAQE